MNYTRTSSDLMMLARVTSIVERRKGEGMAIFGLGRKGHLDCSVHGPLSPDDVLNRTFTVRKVGTGYDPDEVDNFLDIVADAMAGFAAPLTAWDIRQHEFQLTRRVNSFDVEAVDAFLECIAQTLEGRAGGYLLDVEWIEPT